VLLLSLPTLLLLFPLLLLVPFESPYLIQLSMYGSRCLPLALLVTYLAYSSTLKMEVAHSTKTWVQFSWAAQLTSLKILERVFLFRACSPIAYISVQ
jgi:hypothetical protein